jgi:polyhydroxyalkanoate synthesis regulator phasin
MADELKNIFLAGLGAAAYTYEKASKVVDEMVEKGKISMEEGKELTQQLKRNLSEKAEQIKPLTKEELLAILSEKNYATKDEVEVLKERIAKLENKTE